MNRSVVLLSGGLDSTVLAAHLLDAGDEVVGLGVHYGQTHVRELRQARWIADELGVPFHFVSLPALGGLLPSQLTGGGGSKVVPNRNAILVSVAVGFAAGRGFDSVALGVNTGDARDFPDCRPDFLLLLTDMARAEGVHLLAPFIAWPKSDVVVRGRELDAPIHLSRSCYRNGELPCGVCDACRDRIAAVAVADSVVPS